MTLRIGRPRLQSERANDAVVAVIALQHDAYQRRHRNPTLGAQFQCHHLPLCRIESSERLPGAAPELVERFPHQARVAAEGSRDVGLDRRVVGAGNIELGAGWDHHTGDVAQIVALRRGQGDVGRHGSPQSNRLARRCLI